MAWLEDKFQKHGIQKVIPRQDTLESAYRRALQIKTINEQMPEIIAEAGNSAAKAKIPRNLRRNLDKRLAADPTLAWDDAMRDIVAATKR